jgi:hypothetical protein
MVDTPSLMLTFKRNKYKIISLLKLSYILFRQHYKNYLFIKTLNFLYGLITAYIG